MLPIVMLLLAQDIPGPPGDDAPVVVRPLTADPRDCRRGSADEIVVCGQQEDFRVRPLPPASPRWDGRVALSPNTRAGIRVEPSGNVFLPAPRLMVDFTILF